MGVCVRDRAVGALFWRAALAGLIVVAVFTMHGPFVGTGCAAGDAMPATGSSGMVMDAAAGTAAVGVPGAFAPRPGHGQSCLSTPPRPTMGALLAVLLAVVLVALALLSPLTVPAVLPGVYGRRRAPPLTGTALLRHLCVSRT